MDRLQLSTGLSVWNRRLVVTLLEVSEREEGVVALHLPIGLLKTRSGLEPVPRCEPTNYPPISGKHSYCAIGVGIKIMSMSIRLNVHIQSKLL